MATIEVTSEVIGSVWKIEKSEGDRVAEEDLIMILESMKMENPILAPRSGTIVKLELSAGQVVEAGQLVCILEY